MKKQFFMGIDVGTTGTKVMVFDEQGGVHASAYEEYACIYPKAGFVEQDCRILMDAVYGCCRKVLSDTKLKREEIAGLSISAQRSSTIFLNENGQPLKMISWLDHRAGEEVEEIREKVGAEQFYEITGLPLSTTWMLPKILYVRKKEPEVWKRTKRIVQLHDYILHELGGDDYVSDEAEAGFFGLWDNRNFCWSQELLNAFEIGQELLPEIKASGVFAGAVSRETAEKTGLQPGTGLYVGLGDQNSAALGAGIVEQGMISISIGTGGLATALLDNCYRDPKGNTMVTNHAIHGLWTFEGLQNAAAGVFRWFRDEIAAYEQARDKEGVYDTLNAMAAQVPPGSKGLLMLPFFAGSAAPRWNRKARGCFLGLTMAHDRACMARACMEGITLEQRDIINSIAADNFSFQGVRIVGGATKSEVWNQIQADIYQLPCETLEVEDAAVLGAAICAAAGTGAFPSIKEAAVHMVHVRKRYEPNVENREIYEKKYKAYCKACDALEAAGVFADLECI